MTSTKLPTCTASRSTLPGRSLAKGPTTARSPIVTPSRWEKARMRVPSPTLTPGAKTTLGSTTTSRPSRVSNEKVTLDGSTQGGAAVQGGGAQPRLHRRFGPGELLAIVDAQHLVLADNDDRRAEAALPRQRHDIGEVELPLRVVGADRVEEVEGDAPVKRHQAGIAERHGTFARRGVLLLADREKRVVVRQQASVAGRLARLEAQRHHGGAAFAQPVAQKGERLGRTSGVSAKATISSAWPSAIAARAASTACAVPRRSACVKARAAGAAAATSAPGRSDDKGHRADAGGVDGGENMREHRASGDLVQHLRLPGSHARPLARRQDDGETGAFGLRGRGTINHGVLRLVLPSRISHGARKTKDRRRRACHPASVVQNRVETGSDI